MSGFSLLELMLVIAIAGILTLAAIPSYQRYLLRAQIQEGFAIASTAQIAVTESYQATGVAPIDRIRAGLDENKQLNHGRYVASVSVDHGSVEIRYGLNANKKLHDKILRFTPYVTDDDTILWRCHHGPVPTESKLMPGAHFQPLATDLASSLTPPECH